MMTFAGFYVALILLGAVELALIERMLGPDSERFPCATPWMRWSIKVYALMLAVRAFEVVAAMYHGETLGLTRTQMLTGMAFATCNTSLFILMVRGRMPAEVWRRLERKMIRTRRLANAGPHGDALATLASRGVQVIPPNAPPEAVRQSRLSDGEDTLLRL